MMDAWSEMQQKAVEQIESTTGGSMEYLEWYSKRYPEHFVMFSEFQRNVDSAHGIFPLVPYSTLLGILVAQHRHIHALWASRDLFEKLEQPVSPGLVM